MDRLLRLLKGPLSLARPGVKRSSAPAGLGWAPLDRSHDGMALLNQAGEITDINPRALELLHCALPALAGLDFWEAVPEDVVDQHQGATLQALAASAQHAFVAHHKFEDSWVRYTFRRRATGFAVNLRDVGSTQGLLRQLDDSERYNQLVFEANPTPMWIFDHASLRILAANLAAVEFYGIPHKTFLTLGMGALFPGEGEGAAFARSLLSGRRGHGPAGTDLRLCQQQKQDGQRLLVELACGHMRWGGHQAVLVSLADVSQRHAADAELRRVNEELAQALAAQAIELKNAHRDLAAFTQAVSHDVQGRLHTANGFAKLLAEKYSVVLEGPGLHYLSRIQASIRQLASLVDDLRLLVQLPPVTGTPEKLDLVPLCQALFSDLRRRDPERVVTVEMADSLWLVGDRRLLKTALGCLLENAWKFTSKKADAWIKVGLSAGPKAGELVLTVSDNGAGFDPAYIDRLFTAFARLHSSADFPGNGLGLAIVRQVAVRHGGQVTAHSAGRAGATFSLLLPPPPPAGG
ncbi:ATP-binding protein [Polaromonas sp.]|uniref:sensor histidine kinase n=1 Tax=Polaromonas sp. TaxID=1869339 RepID=UPI00286AD991|nr:ATP-binding protein [Polaromonas sp.]